MPDRDEKGHFLPGHEAPGPGRKEKYHEGMNEQVRKLALLGMKDTQIAEFLEITEETLNQWKKSKPAFSESLSAGKVIADAEVADSLYNRAVGMTVENDKVVKDADGNNEVVTLKSEIPGDPQAAKMWLINRQRKLWTDRQTVDLNVAVEEMTEEQLNAAAEEARKILDESGEE